jgi:hypothetical protein
LGNGAGLDNQGENAIAIGSLAGKINQAPNSIVLNAENTALNALQSGLFVKPIRGVQNGLPAGTLHYDYLTGEITYSIVPNANIFKQWKENSAINTINNILIINSDNTVILKETIQPSPDAQNIVFVTEKNGLATFLNNNTFNVNFTDNSHAKYEYNPETNQLLDLILNTTYHLN